MSHKIIQGDNVATLKTFADNSIDSIITDPPYGIEFLGKDWDSNTGAVETWQECLRVLKPGGYLLAFSAARTYHHLATNIESVGFEIRDQLMWLYASGFPKAQDIGKAIDRRQGKKDPNFKGTETFNLTFGENPGQRLCAVCKKDQTAVYKCDRKDCGQRYQTQTPEAQQWSGWKTALKPAHEPIVMARKPFKGSTIDNVLAHGVGALNIDASRIATDESIKGARASMQTGAPHFQGTDTNTDNDAVVWKQNEQGRFPANVLGEVEGYQKYFYCPKVSRRERHVGFEQMPAAMFGQHQGAYDENGERYAVGLDRRTGQVGNNHPTVKPVELMKYLIKLVTPANSKVLDPFAGSGSTGMAACELGHEFTGCELDTNYVRIANKRITGWLQQNTPQNTQFDQLFE